MLFQTLTLILSPISIYIYLFTRNRNLSWRSIRKLLGQFCEYATVYSHLVRIWYHPKLLDSTWSVHKSGYDLLDLLLPSIHDDPISNLTFSLNFSSICLVWYFNLTSLPKTRYTPLGQTVRISSATSTAVCWQRTSHGYYFYDIWHDTTVDMTLQFTNGWRASWFMNSKRFTLNFPRLSSLVWIDSVDDNFINIVGHK